MVNVLPHDQMLGDKPNFRDRFQNLFKNNGYLLLAFLVPFAVMYLIYLVRGIHPFGNFSVLVLDLNGQYVDFFEALRHFIYGDASYLYSFSRALGGEFMGIYAYYLASPLSYIVALFPQEGILDALLLMFLIKTGLCGFTFGFYLHKTSSFKPTFNRVNVVTFSSLYALTAYCVVQQHNTMWIDAVIWLPIITYGIEELIKKGHYKLYTLSLAIALMSNFYIGYMLCIYTAIYFFIYSYMGNANPYREKAHMAKSFLRILFFSILAVAIAGVVLLTAYYSLTFGKTTFSSTNWDFKLRFELLDMFVKFLPCSYDTVRTEGLPFVYCGMITLLLVPIYFCSPRIKAREKILYGTLVAVFILSFAINPIDLLWHGMQAPNWLNYRYSFILCFILLVMAYKGISEIKRSRLTALVLPSAVILALVAVAQKTNFVSYVLGDGSNDRNHEVGKLLTIECIWFSAILVGVYLIILAVMRKSKRPQNIALVLAVIVAGELFCNGLSNTLDLGSDVVYTSRGTYTAYITHLRGITQKVKGLDGSFYRMDEVAHRKVNDNMAVLAYGLTNSTSTLNATTINFLNNMGYFAKAHEAQYHAGNVVSDSLLGIKYTLDRTTATGKELVAIRDILQDSDLYSLFTKENIYTAYQNKYALSLAYAVNTAIKDIDMADYLNPYDRLNAIITAMLGETETVEVFKSLELSTTTKTNCRMDPARYPPNENANFKHPYIKYYPEDENQKAKLTFVAKTPQNANGSEMRHIYFYLPSEFQRAFTFEAKAGSYGSVFGNNTDRILPIGQYKDNGYVSVTLTLDANVLYLTHGVDLFYYLDEAVFADAMSRLAESQLKIDENYKDDHITGTLTTKKDGQTVFTSIPYDAGWHVYVDGKPVETQAILRDSANADKPDGALIAFDIENSGEHSIELRYMPKEFVLGAAASIIGILVLILISIFEKKVNKFADKILCPIIVPTESEYDIEDDTMDDELDDIPDFLPDGTQDMNTDILPSEQICEGDIKLDEAVDVEEQRDEESPEDTNKGEN